MSLSTEVDGLSTFRASRVALTGEQDYTGRVASAMGPGVDDSSFRQRMMIVATLNSSFTNRSEEARRFVYELNQALPRNMQAIRASLPGHPLRKGISEDPPLALIVLELADANGPLWDHVRSAILTDNADSMLGSLARVYEDGVENDDSPAAMQTVVRRFFERLQQVTTLDRSMGSYSGRIYRATVGEEIAPRARFNYTTGPNPGDVVRVPASGGSRAPAGGQQARGRSGLPSTADFAQAGGLTPGMASPTDGYGWPEPGVGNGSSSATVAQKIVLIRRIASNLGLTVTRVVSIALDCLALYRLITGASGVGAASADGSQNTADELRSLAQLSDVTPIANGYTSALAVTDPVVSMFGRG